MDSDWQKWLSIYPSAYKDTQKNSALTRRINNAGYEILKEHNLKDKNLAEIGPGGGYHFSYLNGTPSKYDVFDVCSEFFDELHTKAADYNFNLNTTKITAYDPRLPLPDNSIDYLLAFYVIEHLYPLDLWLKEIFRVLKPGGSLIGAIPTEGGVTWALGRFATSRKILKEKYALDIRKIVCWEHPNMSDEIIKNIKLYGETKTHKWPAPILPLDLNLIVKFQVIKSS